MISRRLAYIASFVSKDMLIADIGADHGFLTYYLLENNLVKFAYASDNKKGPFENLKATFFNADFNNYQLALKNGLDDLPEYVNAILICGMGGDLICEILKDNLDKLNHVDTLILSPHNNLENVRRFLNLINYKIVDEGIILDEKYYHVIKAIKGYQILSDKEYYFGPILLSKNDDLFNQYYIDKLNSLKNILNKDLSFKRKKEVEQEIDFIKEVINYEV